MFYNENSKFIRKIKQFQIKNTPKNKAQNS